MPMIGLFEDFSKTFTYTNFGNSKWPTIGKILFNGIPEELVKTQEMQHWAEIG